jgi:hypothetical protein
MGVKLALAPFVRQAEGCADGTRSHRHVRKGRSRSLSAPVGGHTIPARDGQPLHRHPELKARPGDSAGPSVIRFRHSQRSGGERASSPWD